MAEGSSQDKTEKPTHRRAKKAHDQGEVINSRELTSTAVFYSGLFTFLYFKFSQASDWRALFENVVQSIPHAILDQESLMTVVKMSLKQVAGVLSPLFMVIVVCGLLANWGQSGVVFSVATLKPQFSRLNFLQGFQNLLSEKIAMESLKTILKLIGVGLIAYAHVSKIIDERMLLAGIQAGPLMLLVSEKISHFAVHTGLFMAGFSAFDYWMQRREWNKNHMMTKQEVKEEMKESEANPQVKSKIKSFMKKMMGRRMMSQVPEAQVVITNPTHLAIALQYKKNMTAPKVLAKGADLIAKRIIKKAREHNVPVIENKPLARLLYRSVEIGDDVPSSLYQAVAEVLAYVYKLKHRVSGVAHAG